MGRTKIMYIQWKESVWNEEQHEVPEDMTPEEFLELWDKGDLPNEALGYKILDGSYEHLTPLDNGGQPTVYIYENKIKQIADYNNTM